MLQERFQTMEEVTAPASGRPLDAEIAERVMGLRPVNVLPHLPDRPPDFWCGEESGGRLPAYSTDIGAAWQVVEEMRRRGFCLVLEEHWTGDAWSACFISEGLTQGEGESWGTSPAWCICSAAIAALDARKEAPPDNG